MTGKSMPTSVKLLITGIAIGTSLGALELQVLHNKQAIQECVANMKNVEREMSEVKQITSGMAANIQGMSDRFDDMYDMVLELWRGE